jgi:MoxR-like ATPase
MTAVQLSAGAAKYWIEVEPARRAELVLPYEVAEQVDWICEQYRRADVLSAAELRPSDRLLFHGPPGVGKSMAARVLGEVLGLPVLLLRMDSVVAQYLGESAHRLREAMQVAQEVKAVFVLDEIDGIGSTRTTDGGSAAQEQARTLNVALSMLDTGCFMGPLVATTNRLDMLDPALLRRWRPVAFHAGLPERVTLALRHGVTWPKEAGELSQAEVVAVCEEARRYVALRGYELPAATKAALRAFAGSCQRAVPAG